MFIKHVFLIFLTLSFSFSHADERILSFVSDITVHKDATLSITETITVQAESDQIKRGLVREFPTIYKDRFGNNYTVDFVVTAIQRNGKDEPYHTKDAINGKRIFIGSSHVFLKPGQYVYTISYDTNRQLGFFEGRDELYWNVTGNGWQFALDKVIVRVHLPSEIKSRDIAGEAYTGFFGERGHDYRAQILSDSVVEFVSTKPFRAGQGLTIVATWPAGVIVRPTQVQLWWDFIKDNLATIWLWFGVLFISILYGIWYLKVRAQQRMKTIIPLFYPPEGLTAGQTRYIDRMDYDNTILTADLVQLAVEGLITIEPRKSFFGTDYVFSRVKDKSVEDIAEHHKRILSDLFGGKDEFILERNKAWPALLFMQKEKELMQQKNASYFNTPGDYLVWGLLLSCICIFPIFIVQNALIWLAAMILAFLFVCFMWLIRGYSESGLKIKEQIEGFRLYLKTAEADRIEMIGTPPTKTPELYEKYLPYAIALGCEKQWTAQFALLFAQMAQAGRIYTPRWYRGHGMFAPDVFASTISRDMQYSFSKPISSSKSRPGSSSGFGGRGSSGGGGGGGGGGGW